MVQSTPVQIVWDRFASLVQRQFGCHVELTDLNNEQNPPYKILNIILSHKEAQLITMQNDLLIPITKNDHLYGYINIVDGITLPPHKIKKVQMLADLLVRSVVIAEHKKQVIRDIENLLKEQIKKTKQINHIKPQALAVQPLPHALFSSKHPVFILANNPEKALQQAYKIHVQSQSLQFISIDKKNKDQLHYPEFISYLGNVTVYVPEITHLSKVLQKSLEKYLAFQSLYSYQSVKLCYPRIIAATTQNIQSLQKAIRVQRLNKSLLCHLSKSRIVTPSNSTHLQPHKDIQNFIRHLFHKENAMDNVIFFKSKEAIVH